MSGMQRSTACQQRRSTAEVQAMLHTVPALLVHVNPHPRCHAQLTMTRRMQRLCATSYHAVCEQATCPAPGAFSTPTLKNSGSAAAAHVLPCTNAHARTTRRTMLGAPINIVAAAVLAMVPAGSFELSLGAAPASAREPLVLQVAQGGTTTSGGTGSATTFTSISAALAAAVDIEPSRPVVIQVAGGTYRERLVITRPETTICTYPEGAAVTVVWETKEPYQSVVDCTAAGVLVRGITLRHSSKSVANNYGIFIHGGSDLVLDQCDISSSTGSGIGVEGAAPKITNCRISGCARHGIAIFGGLGDGWSDVNGTGGAAGGTVQGCDITGNAGDGVLVRDGAAPLVADCVVLDNKGRGLSLQDCGGEYVRNTVRGNAGGALVVVASFELDAGVLAERNVLSGAVRLE